MMQEPFNSWADDALARTAYEPRSKNFPDFLYFVRHSKFCSMTCEFILNLQFDFGNQDKKY